MIRLRGETGSNAVPAKPGTELLDITSERITKHVAHSVVDELTSQTRDVVLAGMTISDDGRTAMAMVESNNHGSDLRARMQSLQYIIRETLQRFEVEVPHGRHQ